MNPPRVTPLRAIKVWEDLTGVEFAVSQGKKSGVISLVFDTNSLLMANLCSDCCETVRNGSDLGITTIPTQIGL